MPIPNRIRLIGCAMVLGSGLGLGLGVGLARPRLSQAAEAPTTRTTDANWNRLRSMPRAQRLALWEKLKEFDRLPTAEKSAIRALDARIAALSAADRENYQSVLRRYHQWVQGLSDEQRGALNAAPAGERMRLVTQLRAEERTVANSSSTPIFLQVFDFSGGSPFETAHRLKAWFDLDAEKRAEIEALPTPAEQRRRLTELGQRVKLGSINRLSKLEEDALLAKFDANPQLKGWLTGPLKKADPPKHEKMKRRIAANYYFLEHPPAAVDPSRLSRFESSLPAWERARFDYLPPEEARRRLSILYRLIFPAPGELPETFPTTNPQKAAAPAPATPAAPPLPPAVDRTEAPPG